MLLGKDNKLVECLNRYTNVLDVFPDIYVCGDYPAIRGILLRTESALIMIGFFVFSDGATIPDKKVATSPKDQGQKRKTY
ncbi:hypothetical protein [Pseudomonas carnis]|uniref:hypothetical protein n=1 Tax=Pseudomonas carnis TaxID=2487355 RepID=UPI001968BE5A|nr:hypothetical protein [Pseudomonas carnis]